MATPSTTRTAAVVRPSEARPPNAKAQCRKCGRAFRSLRECHCTTCCGVGRGHFVSVDAFDRHRVGPVDDRRCLDPATAIDEKGRPIFEAVETAWGISWRRRRNRTPQTEHWAVPPTASAKVA
jgi:hypothetical protein